MSHVIGYFRVSSDIVTSLSPNDEIIIPGGIINLTDDDVVIEAITSEDINYGLLSPEETLIIRAYSDDSDDRTLAELQPKFIVMFEPCMEFARRIEVD